MQKQKQEKFLKIFLLVLDLMAIGLFIHLGNTPDLTHKLAYFIIAKLSGVIAFVLIVVAQIFPIPLSNSEKGEWGTLFYSASLFVLSRDTYKQNNYFEKFDLSTWQAHVVFLSGVIAIILTAYSFILK